MSNETIAKIGGLTGRIAATQSSAAETIGTNSKNLIISCKSGDVFVQTGADGLTIVFPTTTTSQNGYMVFAGQTQTIAKNNPSDTTLYTICDTGLTADVFFSCVEGE